ncbi:Agamous-like MADS-box protein AGL97 [Cardamine amara subsp. amara]|uniref:Agamous-like MADS-box protein AGL97 n=1 Tax=Cardamine amara subsp. amara TaxID=228776 RepID=A0ABD1A3L4_CARAN
MGGIKRKIPLEKKDSRAVAYSKRIDGLYSKASDLCLLSGGQIAITAMNSMSKVLQDLKDLRFDAVEKRGDYEDVKKKGVLHGTHQEHTLDLQPSSSTLCIHDDPPPNFEGFNKNTDEQILAISDNNNNSGLTGTLDGYNQEFGLDQIFDFVKSEDLSMNLEKDDVSMVTTNQNPLSDSETVEDGKLVMHTDGHGNNLQLSDFDENQILPISDNNNALPGNEGLCDQELDLDEFIDFEANCESLLMNLEKMFDISMMTANQNQCYDSEAVEDGGSVIHRDLDEDNLLFTNILNEFASITAL